MIYSLMLWTAVTGSYNGLQRDWRSIVEFQESSIMSEGTVSGKTKCESAAKELGLKPDSYRCIRIR